jgi:hypothetical protein
MSGIQCLCSQSDPFGRMERGSPGHRRHRYTLGMKTGVSAGSRCLDCAGELQATDGYCRQCGQRTDVSRLTIEEIGHEFVHAIVHADRSVLSLLLSLLLRPGVVAREYVAGKRRRHFGPFATMVVLVGVATLLSELVGFESITSTAALNGAQNFINHHVNIIVFVQVPLLSLICWLLFWRDRVNFAEHIVLVAYTVGLRAILFILLVLPVWYFLHPDERLLGDGIWAVWSIYFGIAAAQFYPGNRFLAWVKGTAAAAIIFPATSVLMSAITLGYRHLQGP